ncbi:hypothetical protein ACFFU9_14495 [Mariniflexile ostreae]|uniref:Carboxypeptidase-like protein n=1 Tax=Mariniflexile ostreae TaxID=1520892 RepID=A0ABV5FFV3_9FLAO
MKKQILLAICLVFFGLQAMAQSFKRIEAKGTVVVEKSDVEGIPIVNKTTNAMVFTDASGDFVIQVKLNDSIEVKALQYQDVSFTVNQAVIESGVMKIYLIEEIHLLDEVVVSNNNLTGNLGQDIKHVKTFKPKLDVFYFGISKNKLDTRGRNATALTTVALDGSHNVAMNPERLAMINGLDIVNVVDLVLLPLFRSGAVDKAHIQIPNVPSESIKYYFGSEFLVDNFNIPKHRVEEFIRFVQTNDFDYTLLNYGNEMAFLDVLNKQSVMFLARKE